MSKIFDFVVIVSLPFVIGAIIHFAPAYVSAPATLVLSIFWMGACKSLGATN